MTTQLTLINSSDDRPPRPAGWRLDERTRALGHRGVATARAALREGRDPPPAAPAASPGDVRPDDAGRPAA
ncbi:MAG TPA: hypothetical protein VE575_03470 [Acidimicrobiales bacterium]|nr:hypothetical protein [Acidimicrobiales bacterium]